MSEELKLALQLLDLQKSFLLSHGRQLKRLRHIKSGRHMNHRSFSGIVLQDFDPALRKDHSHHKQGCMQPYRHLTLKLAPRR